MRVHTRILVALGVLLVCPPPATAQRTRVARDFPIYSKGGLPDLVMDPQRFTSQMEIVDRYFGADDGAVQEGVVGGIGYRRLRRFETVVMNRGDGDTSCATAPTRTTLTQPGSCSTPATGITTFAVFPCTNSAHKGSASRTLSSIKSRWYDWAQRLPQCHRSPDSCSRLEAQGRDRSIVVARKS